MPKLQRTDGLSSSPLVCVDGKIFARLPKLWLRRLSPCSNSAAALTAPHSRLDMILACGLISGRFASDPVHLQSVILASVEPRADNCSRDITTTEGTHEKGIYFVSRRDGRCHFHRRTGCSACFGPKCTAKPISRRPGNTCSV